MIALHNGHKFEFACASGALSFDGRGWWWEKPLHWLGYIDPAWFTVITKTLTLNPRKGNLKMWCPWRCVRLIPGGAVNSVGLTNPGLDWWVDRHSKSLPYKTIVSIMPESPEEAAVMSRAVDKAKTEQIVGIQVNVSCPNVHKSNASEFICETVAAVVGKTTLPVMVKLNFADDYVRMCRELEGLVSAFELINTVPYPMVFPGTESPLAKYKLLGGVSGEPIRPFAIEALTKVRESGVKTPIMSGGGIMTIEDVRERKQHGADAFVIGTLFLRKPWKPNKIIREYWNTVESKG